MPFGVYVHYPYCARHCPYCDFTVTVTRRIPHAEYRAAVLAELAVRADDYVGRPPAVSVYFGGGTPGLWPTEHIAAVIDGVERRFGLAADAEITVECNPEDVTAATATALRAAGVNRVSLGVQSFDDGLLARLGRKHSGADARRAVQRLQAGGLDDINVDLMHGERDLPLAGVLADVRSAVALGPTHVSTYQLTVEDKTPFGARARRGERLLVEDGLLAAMYGAVRAALREGGLEPYEVSNAARPGHAARHNNLYWTDGEYLALGAGAHGYVHRGDGGERWGNLRHAGRYMQAALAGAPGEVFRDVLDADERLEDRVLCGLRLDRGLTVDGALQRRFGPAARRLAERGLLIVQPGSWRVSDHGRAILDRVVLDLVSAPRGPSEPPSSQTTGIQ